MINLLVAGNNFASKGLLVIACSLLLKVKEEVTIYFMTMDLKNISPKYIPINDNNFKVIERVLKMQNPSSSLKIVDCTKEYLKTMSERRKKHSGYTPYALCRLFSDLKEDIPDKVLYLDTDIIIAKDISSFYHSDISDYEIAGALDYYGRFWIRRDYINSGVLLMNMKKIRETGFMEKCREFCKTSFSILSDQDAINKLAKKKLIVSDIYNDQSRRPTEKTVIKHFSKQINYLPVYTINIKPWDVEKVHKRYKIFRYDDILNEYLKYEKQLII